MMEPGQLASVIIAGSMSVGVMAILGFCLHVMFNRKFQCDAEGENGNTTQPVSRSNLMNSSRYPSSKIFSLSGRLPPPPPLSPPPPPVDCVVEISHISNTSVTYISESDYESMQEIPSSSDDATIPNVVFTSDLSSISSSAQHQSEGSRAHEPKFGGHLTPTVSMIAEEDEDATSWDSRSEHATTSQASSGLSLRPLESMTTPNYQTALHVPLNVPDTETSTPNAITVPISQTVLSATKTTLHPTSATANRRGTEDCEATSMTPKS